MYQSCVKSAILYGIETFNRFTCPQIAIFLLCFSRVLNSDSKILNDSNTQHE